MAYRADIEIAVKGAREVDQLKNKVDQLTAAIDKIRGARFQAGSATRKLGAFAVAQEQKLLASRRKYNQELRQSITLAVEFQRRIESTLQLLQQSRAVSSRTLSGSAAPVGLLPTAGTAARSRTQRLASRALPAGGQTSNPFFAAQQSAKVIDEQNATQSRLNRAARRRERAERRAAAALNGVGQKPAQVSYRLGPWSQSLRPDTPKASSDSTVAVDEGVGIRRQVEEK